MPGEIQQQNWRNVFNDVTKAAEGLASFRLDLLNDRFATLLAPSVIAILKHETNGYSAMYQLLLATSGTSTSNAVREAMVDFCNEHGPLRNLLLFHLRSPSGTVLLIDQSHNSHPAPLSAANDRHYPIPPDPVYTRMYSPTRFNIGDKVLQFIGTIFSQGWKAALKIPNGAAILASLQPGRGKALVDADLDLPVPGPCFGRSSQISEMEAMLCHSDVGRCVVLGGGGMGKSTLASKVISLPPIRARFRGRRFWIAMESLSNRADLYRKIAMALGLPEDADLRLICVFLLEQPTLLIIDALETYSAACQETLAADIDSLGRVSYIVATHKGTRPPPIQTNWTLVVSLEGLDLAAARETFLLAGTEYGSDPDLDAVLKECEGFPLVLRLMSRVPIPGQPLSFLLDRWLNEKSRLLELGTTKFDSLQVCVSLSLSHILIRSNEQAWDLLRILAAVPTGLLFTEITLLFHSSGIARVDVLSSLGLIVQTINAHNGELRYHLLNPLRILVLDMFACPWTSQVTEALDMARIVSSTGVIRECGLELAVNPSAVGLRIACVSSLGSKASKEPDNKVKAGLTIQKGLHLQRWDRIVAVMYSDGDGHITAACTQVAVPDHIISKACRLLGWNGPEGPLEIAAPLPIFQPLHAPEYRWDTEVVTVPKFSSVLDYHRSLHAKRPGLDNTSQAFEIHARPRASFERPAIVVLYSDDQRGQTYRDLIPEPGDNVDPLYESNLMSQVPWSMLPLSRGWITGIAEFHAEIKCYGAAVELFSDAERLETADYMAGHKKVLRFYSILCRLCLYAGTLATTQPHCKPDEDLDQHVAIVYMHAKDILRDFPRCSLRSGSARPTAAWSGWEAEMLSQASEALDTLGYVYKDRVSPVCVDAEYLLGNFRKRHAMRETWEQMKFANVGDDSGEVGSVDSGEEGGIVKDSEHVGSGDDSEEYESCDGGLEFEASNKVMGR